MTVHPVCSSVNNHSQNSSLVLSPLKTHSLPASSCTTHKLGSWFPFSCRHSKSKNNSSCNDYSTGSSSASRSPCRHSVSKKSETLYPFSGISSSSFPQKSVFSFSWFRVECSSDGPRVARTCRRSSTLLNRTNVSLAVVYSVERLPSILYSGLNARTRTGHRLWSVYAVRNTAGS